MTERGRVFIMWLVISQVNTAALALLIGLGDDSRRAWAVGQFLASQALWAIVMLLIAERRVRHEEKARGVTTWDTVTRADA